MAKFGFGQPVRRVEDARLLTGLGRFTDDITLDNLAWGHVLRSPHAHARIRGLDASAARAMPGVLAILTAEDITAAGLATIVCLAPATQPDGSVQPQPAHPILADGTVRHVGDPVAFVVAETALRARDAAEAIEVDYDPLPASIDAATATRPDAALIHEEAPGNISFTWERGDKAAVEQAFARAAHVVRTRLINNRVVVAPIETRGEIGDWDGSRFTLYTQSQGVHSQRRQLAAMFDLPEESFRVVSGDVGGSFGMKIFMYAEKPLVLLAARLLGRPVKWTGERTADAFLSDSHGRDQINEAELALDADYRFLALRVKSWANMGAYLSNFAPYIPTACGFLMLNGAYRFEAIHSSVTGVFTNTVPVDAYRGAGRPEANYVLERTVDAAARELGIDPAELRRRNFIPAGDLPYKTTLDAVYDSGNFEHLLDEALRHADRAGFAERRAAALTRGKLRGFGIACYIENCGSGPEETGHLAIEADGTATFSIGTQTGGQGHATAYAQIIADRLGLDIGAVRVIQGDTDLVATGTGTGGSRSIPLGGVSCDRAVTETVEKGRRIAAVTLEAEAADIEFADGYFSLPGTNRRASLAEVAAAANDPANLPAGEQPGLNGAGSFATETYTFPNGSHVCEIEIDPETGATEIVKYTVVDDFGTVLNPLMLEGQVHGGIGQGIGQALHELCHYDENGQLISGSFMDYCLPRASDLPAVDFNLYQGAPCTTNPLGMKGAGEAGAVGAPQAVIHAVLDALADRGVKSIDMPATPQAIWRALRGAA